MRISRFLAAVILLGVAVRLVVAAFFSYPYDFHSWALIISNFEAGNGLYDTAGYNYAPPWGYILGFFSVIAEHLGVGTLGIRPTEFLFIEDSDWTLSAFATSEAFNIAYEVMLLLFDLAMSWLLYRFVMERTGDEERAERAFAMWFLCPFVIAVTCVGGMFDCLSALLTLLCLMLVMRGRYVLAGSMIGVAALLKLFPAFLVFVLAGYVVSRSSDRRDALVGLAKAIAGAVGVVIVLLIPQILDGTLPECFAFITSRAGGGLGSGTGMVESIGVVVIYLAILLVSVLIGLRAARYKGPDAEPRFLRLFFFNVAILFIVPSTPQYILLLAPFLIIAAVCADRRYGRPYLVLCVGTTMFACATIVPSMISAAVFTDLVDPSWLVSAIDWSFEWLSSLLYYAGGVLQYIGVLLVLYTYWRRHHRDGAIPDAVPDARWFVIRRSSERQIINHEAYECSMGAVKDQYTKHREGVSYVFWGAFTTIINLLAYAAFVRWFGIDDTISNILSWIVGVLFAFVVNKWFVFRSRGLGARTVVWEMGSFVGSRLFTGVIAWILFPIINATSIGSWSIDLWIFTSLIGTSGMGAKIITSVIEIVLNWILSKYVVFKKGQKETLEKGQRPRATSSRIPSRCPMCLSHVYVSACILAFTPRSCLRASSSSILFIASASAAGSFGGTPIPPSPTTSGRPFTWENTSGFPRRMLSRAASPNDSNSDGMTWNLQREIRLFFSSSDTYPRKSTLPSTPSFEARCFR